MKTYSFRGFVAREATLRAVTAAPLEKLRYGLVLLPVSEEMEGAPASNEVGLSASAAEMGLAASQRGPVAFIEAEVEAGSGFHAAVVWRDGGIIYGPVRMEDRSPVNRALQEVGVMRGGDDDELARVALDERVPGNVPV